ncbi:MAG: Uncharacterised protein [Candidatus Poseidoniaceae archaeon]|nr:MAG: Uncharacterised protein [Candidatus Poseidoniaceae archaeon]
MIVLVGSEINAVWNMDATTGLNTSGDRVNDGSVAVTYDSIDVKILKERVRENGVVHLNGIG